jgi:hypothetical protein
MLNRFLSNASSSGQGDGPTAVLVGHCGFDSGSLTRALRDARADVHVASADSLETVEAAADRGALLLINRVPAGRFDGKDGPALVEHLMQRADEAAKPRVMLISDYEDAQEAAVRAGALPGVGKSELGTADAQNKLRTGLASPVESSD